MFDQFDERLICTLNFTQNIIPNQIDAPLIVHFENHI